MASLDGIEYRRAEAKDAFPLMNLYQEAASNVFEDRVLLDRKQLVMEIESPDTVWIVGDRNGSMSAALSILLDKENGLAKINRLILDPNWLGSGEVLRKVLPLLVAYVKDKGIEVLYNTTRTLSLEQQEITLALGFKLLGVFPSSPSTDSLRLNGLTACYLENVLKEKRHSVFSLHPIARPLFDLVKEQCQLPDVETAARPAIDQTAFVPLPALEVIHAPAFVAHRFHRLKERRSLSVSFYPFHEPNLLITDPSQKTEMFVRVLPDPRFAAIIGERLDLPVNPTEFYHQVSLMLHQRGVSFIEVINDAADPLGIEFIYNASFIPCAYFPAFKRQGDERRDYVVFAKSFERILGAQTGKRQIHRKYLRFLKEYYQLDEATQFNRLTPL